MAQDKKTALKKIIERLHAGEDPEEVKREFREVLGDASAMDISMAEEELIQEGMPREQIHKLCDVHLAVFRESIEKQGDIAPPGHPIHILMHEHSAMLDMAEELSKIASSIKEAAREPTEAEAKRIKELIDQFKDAEKHYLREENALFPQLEKHGITQPPAIMWMEHDQIRGVKKQLFSSILEGNGVVHVDVKKLANMALALREFLSNHFYKENTILFPAAMRVVTEEEWDVVRADFAEVGYCCFVPEDAIPAPVEKKDEALLSEGEVRFESGTLRIDVLEAILNTLPVDITFVDRDDRVRYFSLSKDRIFVRSKAVIGREVQYCHPQKSIDKVNQILDDFKNGRRDVADFWIDLRGRLIYIRYFAVRNRDGKYLGTLEVTQDVTDIKALKGEKRLLDEPAAIAPRL